MDWRNEVLYLRRRGAGGDFGQDRYLDVLHRNLNAALDIGEMRLALTGVAKGLADPHGYFSGFDPGDASMGSHRNIGSRHVSVLDDHDHVFGAKVRFSSDAPGRSQAGRAALPAQLRRQQRLPARGHVRPEHPRAAGVAGLQSTDPGLPGFGPFGTAGQHCFDLQHPAYRRIAEMNALRRKFPVLRHGRQYLRQTSFLGRPFDFHGAGEVAAWSRILDDEEAVIIVNLHGTEPRVSSRVGTLDGCSGDHGRRRVASMRTTRSSMLAVRSWLGATVALTSRFDGRAPTSSIGMLVRSASHSRDAACGAGTRRPRGKD